MRSSCASKPPVLHCLEEAPNLLTYNCDKTAIHFFKQPETPEEIDAAERAMDVCPTLAIENDG